MGSSIRPNFFARGIVRKVSTDVIASAVKKGKKAMKDKFGITFIVLIAKFGLQKLMLKELKEVW